MTTITKKTAQNFRADFMEAMKALEEKYSVEVNLGNITFNDNEIRSKVTAVRKSENGTDEAANRRLRLNSGGKIEYGRILTINGERYEMKDYNNRAPRYPFLGTNIRTGQTYKFPASAVMMAI